MPSARRSRRFRRATGLFAASLSALLITVYLLLASGGLAGLVRTIVLGITADGDSRVSVFGGRSDLFTSTIADSVIVTNEQGLKVGVYGAKVSGSAVAFLLGGGMSAVEVDSLIIITPLPSDEPPDSSLTPVFAGTMAGVVTEIGTLSVGYGRIEDFEGTCLVDSMGLEASIPDAGSVTVDIQRAQASIPFFGTVTGSGTLLLDSLRVSLEDFEITAPPGTCTVIGTLNADSTADFHLSGNLSTSFMEGLPFAAATFTGTIGGSIPSPMALISLEEGCGNYRGLTVGFSADTISATRNGASVAGFQARTGSVSLAAEGDLTFSDLSWNGGVSLTLDGTDLSLYFSGLPGTELFGQLRLSGSGTGQVPDAVALSGGFHSSRVLGFTVPGLTVDCEGHNSSLSGNIGLQTEGSDLNASFMLSLGMDYMPVAWQARLTGSVSDLSGYLSRETPLSSIRGLTAELYGEGNLSAFEVDGWLRLGSWVSEAVSLSGAGFDGLISVREDRLGAHGVITAQQASLNTCGLTVEGIDFSGGLSLRDTDIEAAGDLFIESIACTEQVPVSAGGISAFLDFSGVPEDFTVACSLLVSESVYDSIAVDTLAFSGILDMNGGMAGSGTLSASNVRHDGNDYSLAAVFRGEPGTVNLDTLSITAPGDIRLQLAGVFTYAEDLFGFTMEGITLTRSDKLRLVSEGDLEIVSDSAGVFIDTLWLDLPSGEVSAEGRFHNDSISVAAHLSSVDIASMTSLLAIDVPLSGVVGADLVLAGIPGDLDSSFEIFIMNPTYDEWDSSDSLTVRMETAGDSLVIDGIWSWTDGVRSGARMAFDGIWDRQASPDLDPGDLMWLEAELTGVGDELFYLLPIPLKTSGASVSARLEYQRNTQEFSAGIASHFSRLYLTDPGIEFPGMSLYMTYPEQREGSDYNGSVTLNSSSDNRTTLDAVLLLDVEEDLSFQGGLPVRLKGYSFRMDLTGWETLIAGIGWLQLSGTLTSSADTLSRKPYVSGKVNIDAATISMGGGGTLEGSGSSGSSSNTELPLDLNIRISGDRGIWFRNSFANVEFSTELDISTLRGQLAVGGDVKAVRGGVYLLGREFRITQGEVRILRSIPLEIELDIEAEARIRSSVSGAEYTITVSVTGDPEEPDITLTGSGPAGAVTEQDIVTLLTAGMTYGELQQFDSTALGSVAGNYLGQWLARSIRDDVGLDALQFSPDFSSDTTSLVVNAGKYVLPDLFVSYSSDVFSSDAGTVSAQFFINRDFYLEGSTKSTLTGSHDPSFELHYTYRY